MRRTILSTGVLNVSSQVSNLEVTVDGNGVIARKVTKAPQIWEI
ncbi:hypothetical protein S7335_1037 [Synechococcus sp. PCC 7335]|nr:hypothetical protein [Synechococcus sp. PCC 7335]EDX82734.1 hypothetical protein S7335_1037 [Synechococcus sp. PCC 7335]